MHTLQHFILNKCKYPHKQHAIIFLHGATLMTAVLGFYLKKSVQRSGSLLSTDISCDSAAGARLNRISEHFAGEHHSANCKKNKSIVGPLSAEQPCLLLFPSYAKSQVIPCPAACAEVLCRYRCCHSMCSCTFRLQLETTLHSTHRNRSSVAAERCFNCKNIFFFLLKPGTMS